MSFPDVSKIESKDLFVQVTGPSTNNSGIKGAPNSVWTVEGNETKSPSQSDNIKKLGLKKLINVAKQFLKSILSPSKTAAATAAATENAAHGAELISKTSSSLADIIQRSCDLIDIAGEKLGSVIELIEQVGELTQRAMELNERLMALNEEANAIQEQLNSDDPSVDKAALLERFQAISGEIDGINEQLSLLNQQISELNNTLTELEESIKEQTEAAQSLGKEAENVVTEAAQDEAEHQATSAEQKLASASDTTLGTTGEGVTAGLNTVGAAALTNPFTAALGALAQALGVKTNAKSIDSFGAAGVEMSDSAAILTCIAQLVSIVTENKGIFDGNSANFSELNTNLSDNSLTARDGVNTVAGIITNSFDLVNSIITNNFNSSVTGPGSYTSQAGMMRYKQQA